jgi:hypothetical protein
MKKKCAYDPHRPNRKTLRNRGGTPYNANNLASLRAMESALTVVIRRLHQLAPSVRPFCAETSRLTGSMSVTAIFRQSAPRPPQAANADAESGEHIGVNGGRYHQARGKSLRLLQEKPYRACRMNMRFLRIDPFHCHALRPGRSCSTPL